MCRRSGFRRPGDSWRRQSRSEAAPAQILNPGPNLTADASTPTTEARTQSFEADVSRLLHLMVHSVYSDRDIFVRELVSNAADACEKLRYEAISKPELIEDGAPFAIEIAIDPDAKTLTFSDNGVGMTREDLTEASAPSPVPAPRPSWTSSPPTTRARRPRR
jgi:hypothetical protein